MNLRAEPARPAPAELDVGFIMLDRRWRYTYVNEAAASALDGRPEQLLGRDLRQTVPGVAGTPLETQLRRAMEERRSVCVEHRAHDGTGRWCESRAYPIGEERLAVVIFDLTERLEAERQLKQIQERLEHRAQQLRELADRLAREDRPAEPRHGVGESAEPRRSTDNPGGKDEARGGEPPSGGESSGGGGEGEGEDKADGDRSIRVVLADDHRIVREGLARLLASDPVLELVGEAEDGKQALALAEELRPDVVVLDVAMPGLGGVEAAERIRQRAPGTVVIALSMHVPEAMAEAMREAGAAVYLNKQAASTELASAIHQYAGGNVAR